MPRWRRLNIISFCVSVPVIKKCFTKQQKKIPTRLEEKNKLFFFKRANHELASVSLIKMSVKKDQC